MRTPALSFSLSLSLAAAAAFLLAGCSVDVVGAPCNSDDNCPDGQFCDATQGNTCQLGTRPDGGNGTDGGADGGGCPATACAVGTATKCGEDGTIVTCAADTNGCGVFPTHGGTACDTGMLCAAVNGAATCVCPDKGDKAGDGCDTVGARACSNDVVLHCVQSNTCHVWTPSTDCGELGLQCGDGQSTSACLCPDYKGTTINANPVKGHDPGGDVQVNGTDANPACQYRRLTDAIAQAVKVAPQSGKVVANGFPLYGTWQPNTPYAEGDRISPTKRNLMAFEAITGGTSGATEPMAWPSEIGTEITDGTVTWKAIGPDWAAFGDEPGYPVDIPSGLTVLGSCSAQSDGGTNCDPTGYAIVANGPQSANVAAVVKLEPSSTLGVMSVAAGDGGTGASGIVCESGKVTVGGTWVFGQSAGGAILGKGYAVTGDCGLTAESIAAMLVNGPGLEVNTTNSGTIISSAFFGVYDEQKKSGVGNVNGILFKKGAVEANTVIVAASTSDGIVISAPDVLTLANVYVAHNGEANVGANAANGVRITNGNVTFYGLGAAANGRSGVRIEGGTLSLQPAPAGNFSDFEFNGTTYNLFDTAPNGGLEVAGGSVQAKGLIASNNFGAGVVVSGTNATASITSLTASKNLEVGAGIGKLAGSMSKLDLVGAAIDQNGGPGIAIGAGAMTVTGTSSITSNGKLTTPRSSGVETTGGVLTIDGTSLGTATIPISDSGLNGINVSGGQITLNNVAVTQNAGFNADGLRVRDGASVVSLTNCTVANNTQNGIELEAGIVTVSGTELAKNGQAGAVVSSSTQPAQQRSLSFTSCQIHDNGVSGIANVNGTANSVIPKIAIDKCDVTLNGTGVSGTSQIPSGVSMAAPADLTFTGNKVHGNKGRQISLAVPPKATTAWNIASAGCTIFPPAQNLIYCYDTPPMSSTKLPGLEAGVGVSVNAQNVSWANQTPMAGQDWTGMGVIASPSCGAVNVACP